MTLLYRAQHPATYEGRLRTIQSADVELELSMVRGSWPPIAGAAYSDAWRRAATPDGLRRRPPLAEAA
jgi:hypothetical protein